MTYDPCRIVRQNDEWLCSFCGLRWATDEDRPACAMPAPPQDLRLAIAQAITGPRTQIGITRQKMLELRAHKWSKMVTNHERLDAGNAAQAILIELKLLDPLVLAELLKKVEP